MPSPQEGKTVYGYRDARKSGLFAPPIQMGIVKTVDGIQPTVSAMRVLIADRDRMSSDLLATQVSREETIQATSVLPDQLLASVGSMSPQLIVIGADLNHESESGFRLANTIHHAYPTLPIVMILNQSIYDDVMNAFRSGARGVFSRQQSMADFVHCLASVSKGQIWAGEQESKFLLDAVRSSPSPDLQTSSAIPQLSARELQVVKCAARGKTNKAIAEELGLSEHTVKNYMFRAFEKLGVSNRIELLFCLTQGGYRTKSAPEPSEFI
jgi:two-component system nitrate/nitrite response regulator NarL